MHKILVYTYTNNTELQSTVFRSGKTEQYNENIFNLEFQNILPQLNFQKK